MAKLSKKDEDLFKYLVKKAYDEKNKAIIQHLASQLHKAVSGKSNSKLIASQLEEYCVDEDPLFAGLASTALFYHNNDEAYVKHLEFGGLGLVSTELDTSEKLHNHFYSKNQMGYTTLLEKIVLTKDDPKVVSFMGDANSFLKSNVDRNVSYLRWYDENCIDTEFTEGSYGATPATDGHLNKVSNFKHLTDMLFSGLKDDEREYVEDNFNDDLTRLYEDHVNN